MAFKKVRVYLKGVRQSRGLETHGTRNVRYHLLRNRWHLRRCKYIFQEVHQNSQGFRNARDMVDSI